MPYKSEAQRKYMNAAAGKGTVSKAVVEKLNKESKGKKLPKKAKKKK